MTMKERLQIHKQIVRENYEHFMDWQAEMYWESLSVDEIANMITEKDRAMEWDEQFGFLCELLDTKTAVV